MSQHHATFTWGAGPNSVHISGGFNNWSATASPLHKQQDGTFIAEIPLPWGEKQAFKYVVDGDWKVREDEAKEWDAAGNMNNVYTAPPQPVEAPKPAPVAAAVVPTAAASSKSESEPVAAPSAPEPATVTKAPEPAPVPAIAKVEPDSLVAAAAPTATSTGSSQLNGYALGAPVFPTGVSSTAPATSAPVPATASTQTSSTPAGPATIEKTISSAEEIEKTAAKANVGEAPLVPQEEGIFDKATALGATALAGLGAYVGAAAVAVEKATGVDLTHGQPLTIAEAKAAGLDLNRIEKRDAETDALSPVGTKPPSAAVDDLSRKVQDLDVGSASAPKHEEERATDLPAQSETSANHKSVPMPVITAVSEKDPKKDRSLEGAAPGSAAKPIGTDPSISAKAAKVEAEVNPGKTGSTLSQVHGSSPASASTPVPGPAATGPLPSGGAMASPDRASTNPDAPAPPKKDTSSATTAPATSISKAPEAKSTPAASGGPIATPASAAAFAAATPTPAAVSTPVVASTAVPAVVSKPAAVAPSTPAKASPAAAQNGTPSSIQTTPASTPVKAGHQKESTSGSDVRKRKSSFFHKLKSAFSPKDKEKK